MFPAIVEEATTVGEKTYFENGSGISLNIFSGRTRSIKGKTPVVYGSGKRITRTTAAAITPEGDMYFETFERGTTAERYKGFLEHLNTVEEGIAFVIHDGSPPHKSLLVKDYVESTKGKLKKQLGKRAHKSLEDLAAHANEIMADIECDRKLVASLYTHVHA